MSWGYRPALDGARTLAVYLVVLFHAGLPWMDGGFIGVDLFFVLSGFLVATILLEELDRTGRLDLVAFYDRRVRRLLPAAVLLVVVTTLVGVLVLSAADRAATAGDARAALLYYANWHFMAESSDYFGSTVVDSSLFLHFWSLSIEEQFYAAFPVLLLLLHRVGRRRATWVVLGLLLVASVVAQRWWAAVDANHAYYGTDSRLYQLLAGVLLALALQRRTLPARVAAPATLLGTVALVALAGSWVDLSPSWRGVGATVGGVLLVAGLSPARTHLAARPFTLPPVVHLGRISYGTYLWHWPVVVVLGRLLDPPAWQLALLVVGLSTALAEASYHLLETPIRRRRVRPRLRPVVVLAGLAASAVAAFAVVAPVAASRQPVAIRTDGPVQGVGGNVTGPPPDLDYATLTSQLDAPTRECAPDDLAPCELVRDQDGPTLLVLGDSQAREMEVTLRRLAREHGFNLTMLTMYGCPWAPGLHNLEITLPHRERCEALRSGFWRDVVDSGEYDALLLVQQDRSTPLFDRTLSAAIDGPPVADQDSFVVDATEKALARLDRLGVPTVLLDSLWLPADDVNPMSCLSGATDVAQCRVTVRPGTSPLEATYRLAAIRDDDVHLLDLSDVYCPRAPVCDAVLDDIPVWRDNRHVWSRLQQARREQIWAALEATGVLADR